MGLPILQLQPWRAAAGHKGIAASAYHPEGKIAESRMMKAGMNGEYSDNTEI